MRASSRLWQFLNITNIFMLTIILCNCSFEGNYMSHYKKLHGKIAFGHSGDIKIFDIYSSSTYTILSTSNTSRFASQPVWGGGSNGLLIAVKDSLSDSSYIARIDNKNTIIPVFINKNKHCDFPSPSLDMRNLAFLCGHWEEKLGRIDYRLSIMNMFDLESKFTTVPVLPYRPSWSPNGEDIVAVDINKSIILVNSKTGSTKQLCKGIAPAFSPDGKFIAYFKQIPNSNKSDLMLYDVNANLSTAIIKSKIFDNSPQWTSDGNYILYQRYGFVFLSPEKPIIEAYYIKQRESYKILEVKNKIQGFSFSSN
jgi:WD40-like Beta Propeller Repeat